MRSRSRINIDETTDLTRIRTWVSGPDSSKSYVSSSFDSESMIDVETPGFHKAKASGRVVLSPMTKARSTTITAPVRSNVNFTGPSDGIFTYEDNDGNTVENLHQYETSQSGDVLISSDLTEFQNTVSVDSAAAIDKAVNAAWANIDVSKANSLVSILEAKKTASSIQGVCFKLLRILRDVKKLDLKALRDEISPKELADGYMTARYAVRPLIIDASQINSAWNHVRDGTLRYTARGSAKDSDSVKETISNVAFTSYDGDGNSYVLTKEGKRDLSVEVNVRAGVLYTISASKSSALQTWGMTDVPLAIYELIPFSFIAGWFINLADTIGAWSVSPFANVLGAWYVVDTTTYDHVTTTTTGEYHQVSSFDDKSNVIGTAIAQYDYESSYDNIEHVKERVIGDYRTTPSIDINLDFFKLADMAIIMRGLLSR